MEVDVQVALYLHASMKSVLTHKKQVSLSYLYPAIISIRFRPNERAAGPHPRDILFFYDEDIKRNSTACTRLSPS